MPDAPRAQYDGFKISKPGMLKLPNISYDPWLKQDEPVRPCWKKPSLSNKLLYHGLGSLMQYGLVSNTQEGKQQFGGYFDGYIFFSLIAIAVAVARQLGATLALSDIGGDKLGEKRHLGEIYDVENFVTRMNGVVRVEKESLLLYQMEGSQLFESLTESLRTTYLQESSQFFKAKEFEDCYFSSSAIIKGQDNQPSNALAMFESLKLQPGLQELADSMACDVAEPKHQNARAFCCHGGL